MSRKKTREYKYWDLTLSIIYLGLFNPNLFKITS